MKKTLPMLVVCVMTITLAFACGQASEANRRRDESGTARNPGVELRASAPEAAGLTPPAPGQDQLAAALENRVRVMTGSLSLSVADIKPVEEGLAGLTKKYAGYVAQSELTTSSGSITVKIPSARFEDFVAEAEKLGTLLSKNINVEDVTDRYFDLENRIKNKRILLERYQEYLRRAVNTRELLEMEQWISSVTTDIEGLEGSFRGLKNSVVYSTLSVSVEIPQEQFAAGMADAWGFMKTFLYYLILVIVYTLIIAVSLILVAGGIYFVGFGRLGLIFKFFRALAPKKKTAAGTSAGKN